MDFCVELYAIRAVRNANSLWLRANYTKFGTRMILVRWQFHTVIKTLTCLSYTYENLAPLSSFSICLCCPQCYHAARRCMTGKNKGDAVENSKFIVLVFCSASVYACFTDVVITIIINTVTLFYSLTSPLYLCLIRSEKSCYFKTNENYSLQWRSAANLVVMPTRTY